MIAPENPRKQDKPPSTPRRQYPARKGQLPLFRPEEEALRELREEYNGLALAHETLMEQYTALRQEHRTLQAELDQRTRERDAVQARLDQAQAALDRAQRQARQWQTACEFAAMVRTGTPPGPTLELIMKHLLTLAHPDKWSQGQPATALAQELAIAINDARAQLEALP